VLDENSINGIKKAVQKVIKLDSQHFKKYLNLVKKQYNWKEQEKILLEVYSEL
jgi:hypothetical protein